MQRQSSCHLEALYFLELVIMYQNLTLVYNFYLLFIHKIIKKVLESRILRVSTQIKSFRSIAVQKHYVFQKLSFYYYYYFKRAKAINEIIQPHKRRTLDLFVNYRFFVSCFHFIYYIGILTSGRQHHIFSIAVFGSKFERIINKKYQRLQKYIGCHPVPFASKGDRVTCQRHALYS